MTQEDKQLLLQDLCARLPYGVKINSGGIGKTLESITIKPDYIEIVIKGTYAYCHFIHKDTGEWDNDNDLGRCKPYLRHLSSMTEEEREDFWQNVLGIDWRSDLEIDEELETVPFPFTETYCGFYFDNCYLSDTSAVIDWLNAHHFDYRGLIEKGLAIAVTADNNPYTN